MKYNQEYEPILWEDEILDQNGNVIQQGTPMDEVNFNRMEAGIDMLNTLQVINTENARTTRSNQIELDKWKNQRIQEGVVTITNSDTNKYFRASDPYVLVALTGYTQIDTPNYSILTEIVSGDPGLIGSVAVYDKTSNGFKISYSGTAPTAMIRWCLVNPDV